MRMIRITNHPLLIDFTLSCKKTTKQRHNRIHLMRKSFSRQERACLKQSWQYMTITLSYHAHDENHEALWASLTTHFESQENTEKNSNKMHDHFRRSLFSIPMHWCLKENYSGKFIDTKCNEADSNIQGMYLEIKHVWMCLSHPPFWSRKTLAILFIFYFQKTIRGINVSKTFDWYDTKTSIFKKAMKKNTCFDFFLQRKRLIFETFP